MLAWYNLEKVPQWLNFLVEEELDQILSVESIYANSKIFRENHIIRQTFLVLGKDLGNEILRSVYQEENLQRWTKTGMNLIQAYEVVKIPLFNVKQTIRRRGHRGSHSNKHKSRDERRRVMESIENRSLEEIKRDILKKQALLFEHRLELYLQLEEKDIPRNERREIFNRLLDDTESLREMETEEQNTKNPEKEKIQI